MFICKICGLQYNSKSGYNKHIRIKHEKKDKAIYTCNYCNKIFTNKKHLKNEMQLPKNYKYICSFENCNEQFKYISLYKNNFTVIHQIDIVNSSHNFSAIEGRYLIVFNFISSIKSGLVYSLRCINHITHKNNIYLTYLMF